LLKTETLTLQKDTVTRPPLSNLTANHLKNNIYLQTSLSI